MLAYLHDQLETGQTDPEWEVWRAAVQQYNVLGYQAMVSCLLCSKRQIEQDDLSLACTSVACVLQ